MNIKTDVQLHPFPFPWAVIDDAFPEPWLAEIDAAFDDPGRRWHQHRDNKFSSNHDIAELGAIKSLREGAAYGVVGELFPDLNLLNDMNMYGAGLHRVEKGGKLGMHVDFNRIKEENKLRAVNTILYLNELPDDGGNLILSEDGIEPNVTIKPKRNRWVIFEYSDKAWHGHPVPCSGQRRSVAFYFYVPCVSIVPWHDTIYKGA
jgi:Rps23 Pro-64 3,4-dihydroxylase Tpa1-like proline 4-hydroxylase